MSLCYTLRKRETNACFFFHKGHHARSDQDEVALSVCPSALYPVSQVPYLRHMNLLFSEGDSIQ